MSGGCDSINTTLSNAYKMLDKWKEEYFFRNVYKYAVGWEFRWPDMYVSVLNVENIDFLQKSGKEWWELW